MRRLKKASLDVWKGPDYGSNLKNLSNGRLLNAKEFVIKEINERGSKQPLADYQRVTPDTVFASLSVSALGKKGLVRHVNLERPLNLTK